MAAAAAAEARASSSESDSSSSSSELSLSLSLSLESFVVCAEVAPNLCLHNDARSVLNSLSAGDCTISDHTQATRTHKGEAISTTTTQQRGEARTAARQRGKAGQLRRSCRLRSRSRQVDFACLLPFAAPRHASTHANCGGSMSTNGIICQGRMSLPHTTALRGPASVHIRAVPPKRKDPCRLRLCNCV